jgi:addiction module HigA family antidote
MLRKLMSEIEGLTQERLAEAMRVSRISVNQLVNGRRAVTAEMSLRLAAALNTSPEFWLNLQQASDLEIARHRFGAETKSIAALRAATPAPDALREIA